MIFTNFTADLQEKFTKFTKIYNLQKKKKNMSKFRSSLQIFQIYCNEIYKFNGKNMN